MKLKALVAFALMASAHTSWAAPKNSDWNSFSLAYVLYTTDVDFYRSTDMIFKVSVCDETDKRCESLAESQPQRLTDSEDKIYHDVWRLEFTRASLEKSLKKLSLKRDQARLRFEGSYPQAKDLQSRFIGHGGPLTSFIDGARNGTPTARGESYNKKTGMLEVHYINMALK